MNLIPTPDFSFSLAGIADGAPGIAATLRAMSAMVLQFKVNPYIRFTATDIVAAWPEKDGPAEASALQVWVRDQVRYVMDVEGIETLQTPDVTLAKAAGDCDDKSILLATLLASIGYLTRFVALGYQPGQFVHVLVEVNISGAWWPLETTEPVAAGWYPPDMPYRLVQQNGTA